MGNKSSKGNSKADLSQGFHCFYIKGKNEVRCFLIIQEDFLILMQSDKKNALMSISLDQSFKVTSEVQEKLSLVISYSSIKGLSTCILKTETKDHFIKLTSFFKSLNRPLWDDTASLFCKICAREFNLFRRQHHCRNCGIAVCSTHCNRKVELKDLGYSKTQRVCSACFQSLKNI